MYKITLSSLRLTAFPALLGVLLLLAVQPTPALAAAKDAGAVASNTPHRPKIGLVLAGGGAKGAAHVGVLKVLEALNIPVDYIAGTSMGSVVGGLYASGMRPDEIEREIGEIDWEDVFIDDPDREDRSFRRKSDDRIYMFKARPGLKDGKVTLPLAYIHGQKFDMQLNRLTRHVATIKDFDRLPIPFRAVAADIETGEEAIIKSGKLARAIRASMAVPGAFDPVEIGDRLLVDGGIANNIPISVARAMGADIVIVSELGTDTLKRDEITSAVSVAGQMVNFLFVINSRAQLKTLKPQDIRISVKLGDIGAGSFERIQEAIPLGEQAARRETHKLQALSLPPEAYAAHLATRNTIPVAKETVDSVQIVNNSSVSDAVISSNLRLKTGAPLDIAALEEDIQKLYGLDIFESVRYALKDDSGKTDVVVYANEKPWGPRYLQFGMITSSDFRGDESYRIGVTLTHMPLNALNGELRFGGQIGDEPGVFTELFQPLDPAAHYFFNGRIGYGVRTTKLYEGHDEPVSEIRATGGVLDVAVGRQFGAWGEARLGYKRNFGRQEVGIGPDLPDENYDLAQAYLKLSSDKLDNLFFPTRGHIAGVEYRVFHESLGSDGDFQQIGIDYMHAATWKGTVWMAGTMLRSTVQGEAPPMEQFRLGGFLRVSGFEQDQLSGQHAALVRAVVMRPITDFRFFKGYAGISVEAGNVWQSEDNIRLGDTLVGGSVFVGANTPIGPLYLGYGYNETGNSAFYLYLGPLFSF